MLCYYCGQAQQKMHCALQTASSGTPEISDSGSSSLACIFQEQNNLSASLEDCDVSSLSWRNSEHRCSVITFLSVQPDGNWRVVALPFKHPDQSDHLRSGAQVNMETFQLVYPPPINSFKANRRKLTKGPVHGGNYCVSSFTNRRIPSSTVRHQPRNKASVNKTTKWNELPPKDCEKSLSCCESSCMIPNGSNTINSTEMFTNSPKVNNVVKKNSKKKARKKGKSGKKYSCDTVIEQEVSEEYVHGSFNNVDHGDGKLSSSTALEVESPKTSTCSSDEVDVPGVTVPYVIQKSTEKHPVSNLDSTISICGGVEDMYGKSYCNMHDSFLLETISIGSNGDNFTNFGLDSKQSEKESCRTDHSERECYDVSDTFDQTERAIPSRQGCSINDMQVVTPGKITKQNKIVPRISNVSKAVSVGNCHGRSGKENNHSVWQKVQRGDANGNTGELKKVPICSQSDITAKEAPELKRTCNTVEDKKQSKDKVSQKFKRKSGLASKQEYNCYSRKGAHANVANSDGVAKFNTPQNEIPDVSSQVNDENVMNTVPGSLSQTNFPRSGFQSGRVEDLTTESVPSIHVHPNEMDPLESACNCSTSSQKVERDSSSPAASDIFQQSDLVQAQTPVFLPHLFFNGSVRQGQREISPAECGKQSHSSGSTLQKWIPIGSKDTGLTSSDESSLLEHSGESVAESWSNKTSSETEVLCDSLDFAVDVSCMHPNVGHVTCSLHENECLLPKLDFQDPNVIKEQNSKQDTCHHLNIENKYLSQFESDSKRIAQAVNDTCRLELASETVQMANGGPIAEIERILHRTSPVICSPRRLISCHSCLEDHICGVSLCRHETPNISLREVWQWYEKLGNYGMEIKMEDHVNSKRFGASRSLYCSYFVPFLSAVQLFRNRKNHIVDTSNKVYPSEMLGEKSDKSPTAGCLPIFSLLLPQPCKVESTPPLIDEVCNSGLSSASTEFEPIGTTSIGDVELIFEYFESEQPQLRRPLFEKIKELVRGEGPSDSNVYGDPINLDYTKLNDLHPRSWYAVAWYPIYRIPEGNLRAAFLTYHSFGHLVRRTATDDAQSSQSVVAPVVGLQSYNTQGECWFQPRESARNQTTEAPDLNPTEVLKQRLQKLEETACLMARAVVKKGNAESPTRHSDFEFFLSRRR
ncbi:uncharacterized protein LOC107419732 isoform X2 [Ziziphus jujuba]|uniref:Uncharacterized protein LOC107419732 isoform X2 n=1 Tax=Ziziphus jujuba TaxID=326968 RepID=A0ABM3IK81_ZIZJJ|nr:uncharacterized protein LOC107419732 isoform X2 [Ziziphus jujuba]